MYRYSGLLRFRNLSLIFILVFGMLMPSLSAAETAAVQAEYYVSPQGRDTFPGSEDAPFQTIYRARDVVRTLIENDSMTGDIIIYLRGGRYEINQTVEFDERDSGTNGFKVLYRNYPGETPVLDGGVMISNWQKFGENVYMAKVPSGFNFRQLYVDGKRAIRAREPDVGDSPNYYKLIRWNSQAEKTIVINRREISSWKNLNNVEMVITRSYTQNRLRIAKFEYSNQDAWVTPMEEERLEAWGFPAPRQSSAYYMENAYEFMDTDTEWYLNTATSTLYYRDSQGKIPSAKVVAPKTERLIELDGASNIWFYGLRFENTTWLRPSTHGYVQRQGGLYWDQASGNGERDSQGKQIGTGVPAAIYIRNSHNLLFQRNIIRHTGGNGINFDDSTYENQIVGNLFHEIGDTAILLGMDQEPYPRINIAGNTSEENRDELIDSNYFFKMGVEYSGSMAIFSSFPNHIVITHNEVESSDNLAMNIGWNNYSADDTALRNMFVAYNNIHDVGQRHDDNGGIHLKNYHADGHIFENYIHHVYQEAGYPAGSSLKGGGIYLDNKTAGLLINRNVFHDNQNNFRHNTTGGNTLTDNESQYQSVISNAGLRPEFADIKNWANDDVVSENSIGGEGTPQLLAIPVAPGARALLPFADDFTQNAVNSIPAGYQIKMRNPKTVLTGQEAYNKNKVLRLIDTDSSTDKSLTVTKYFSAQQYDNMSLEFRVKAEQKTGSLFVGLQGETVPALWFVLSGNGNFRVLKKNGHGHHDIQSYNTNTWYTIRLEAEVVSQTYDVYVDGVLKLANYSFVKPVHKIDKLEIAPRWGTGIYDVDDIKIEKSPVKTLVDTFTHHGQNMYEYSPNMMPGIYQPARFSGDTVRIRRNNSTNSDGYVIYKISPLSKVTAKFFVNNLNDLEYLSFAVSEDGTDYTEVDFDVDVNKTLAILRSPNGLPLGKNYLKIIFKKGIDPWRIQLSEIAFTQVEAE